MDGYLPINEFAIRIGKSKQSIYKKLNKDDSPLAGYTREADGKIYISISAIKEVYGISGEVGEGEQPDFQPSKPQFQPEQPEIKPEQPHFQPDHSTIQPDFQPDFQPKEQNIVSYLMEQLAQKQDNEKRLNDIIADKDKQIKAQAEELAQLANKLATIANNALLTTAQTKYISSNGTVEQQEEEYTVEPKEEVSTQPTKKSFIRKVIDLFREQSIIIHRTTLIERG